MFWSERKAESIITGQSGSEMKVSYSQTRRLKKKNEYTFSKKFGFFFIFIFGEWRRVEGKKPFHQHQHF